MRTTSYKEWRFPEKLTSLLCRTTLPDFYTAKVKVFICTCRLFHADYKKVHEMRA